MENRIKERLTGALILVAALVIVVPELLSGRVDPAVHDVPAARPATEGPPVRSYTMDLGAPAAAGASGQAALTAQADGSGGATALPAPADVAQPPTPAPTRTPPAAAAPLAMNPPPRPAEAPSPPKPAEQVTHPVAKTKSMPPEPRAVAPKAEPLPAPAAKAAVAAGKGWFVQLGVFAKHDNAQRLVQQLGAKGFAAQVSGTEGSLYRVRVGPADTKAGAAALQARLAGQGFPGALVAP